MPVQFENYTHSFKLKGKPVFAPNDRCRRIGYDVKSWVEILVRFDSFYHHLRVGGHVAALHAHRPHTYFARVDIKQFFYSIGRNRVVRALREVKIPRPAHYGKWSCVKNPYGDPSYSLPYGFVQSPILASLVLMQSAVGELLRIFAKTMTVSVYMDDISLSSNDEASLKLAYAELLATLESSQFMVNSEKLRPPARLIDVFNCDLEQGNVTVSPARVDTFFAVPRTSASEAGFIRYCAIVSRGNST
jgi:hypothetical protein